MEGSLAEPFPPVLDHLRTLIQGHDGGTCFQSHVCAIYVFLSPRSGSCCMLMLTRTAHPFKVDTKGAPTSTILCCQCGDSIVPNQLNMCLPCIKSRVDITLGISKQVTIFFCRGCGRYQRPPWISAELESRELLALCLKKIRGLGKVKMVDAVWIWTEPHSRRLKVKITVQKEVFNNAIIQQTFVVEFTVANQQCTDCQKSYTEHTWESVVQVRQKVRHKRTFMWLEQLLIKHGVCEKCINIRDQPDGLDFYYGTRSLGQHMVSFLESVIPVRAQFSKKLITQDDRSNTYRYKYTWCVEIAPVCRDDLVVLNKRLCASMGGITPLLVCYKVGSAVSLIDPATMQRVAVGSKAFWRDPPVVACSRKQLREFVVLDVQLPHHPDDVLKVGNMTQGEITVMRANGGDEEEAEYCSMTHLAHQLSAGDTCMGYDLRNLQLSDSALSGLRGRSLPEVIIIRKSYPTRKNRARDRKFTLKTLNKEVEQTNRKVRSHEDDLEDFMNDIEENPDMRSEINLYKKSNLGDAKARSRARGGGQMATTMDEDEEVDDDDGFPEIRLDELIDDMGKGLRIGGASSTGASGSAMDAKVTGAARGFAADAKQRT